MHKSVLPLTLPSYMYHPFLRISEFLAVNKWTIFQIKYFLQIGILMLNLLLTLETVAQLYEEEKNWYTQNVFLHLQKWQQKYNLIKTTCINFSVERQYILRFLGSWKVKKAGIFVEFSVCSLAIPSEATNRASEIQIKIVL